MLALLSLSEPLFCFAVFTCVRAALVEFAITPGGTVVRIFGSTY